MLLFYLPFGIKNILFFFSESSKEAKIYLPFCFVFVFTEAYPPHLNHISYASKPQLYVDWHLCIACMLALAVVNNPEF